MNYYDISLNKRHVGRFVFWYTRRQAAYLGATEFRNTLLSRFVCKQSFCRVSFCGGGQQRGWDLPRGSASLKVRTTDAIFQLSNTEPRYGLWSPEHVQEKANHFCILWKYCEIWDEQQNWIRTSATRAADSERERERDRISPRCIIYSDLDAASWMTMENKCKKLNNFETRDFL